MTSSLTSPACTPLTPYTAVATLPAPRISRIALATVTLAHAGLLGALLHARQAPEAIVPPRPLTVSLIEAEREAPQPEPEPRPTPPAAEQPPPVLAAERPLPAAVPPPIAEINEPEPVPEPVAEPEPVAKPVPLAPAEAPSTPAPVPPAPRVPPRPADYRTNPKPPYPTLSRRLGEAGTVHLDVLVNPDGSIAQLVLARSSGYPRLDRSAIETVQARWKFEPAHESGKPVAAWVTVPIQFTLRS